MLQLKHWQFTIFFCVITVILIFLLLIIRRNELKRIELESELRKQKLENEKYSEIDQLKSRFFANLSHEFRTLLTLVSGPIDLIKNNINQQVIRQNLPLRPYEQIKRKLDQEVARKNYEIIQHNALQLNRLVTQLLELSQLDSGKLALKTKPVEIISVLKNIVLAFSPYAQNHGIELIFQSDQEALFAFIDFDKFEIIINNLLSNAVKFTPDGGNINVSIKRKNSCLTIQDKQTDCFEIQISDSGIGISDEKIDKIFDRFFQANTEHTNVKEGMGIGLSLTRELVELHYGKIHVSSTPGQGSVFIIQLPIGRDHLKESEITAEYIKMADLTRAQEVFSESVHEKKVKDPKLPVLLIVEDNPQMLFYIRNCLDNQYQVEEAKNGKEAMETALETMPDIIISDIMMPEMDGITFCKEIRNDCRTNHIPVIFLTARAEDKDKITGIECGADEYIVKPFNAYELNARIKNVLKQRKVFREKIQKDLMMEPNLTHVKSMDELFIQKARDLVQTHLDDYDYTIENFAAQMAMSRFHLNRKLQHITGMSSSRFIREIRLRKAAHLIESKTGTISEIALDVGFDNFAYFNRCFKEKYGCSPSKYHIK